MTSDRIDELLRQTAYPESNSVRQALLQVWNECAIESKSLEAPKSCDGCIHYGCDIVEYRNTCKLCGRINGMTDYYETKDTK